MKNIFYKIGILSFVLLIAAGCNYEEQFDPNNPSLGSDASVSALQGMVTGLEARHRQYYGSATGSVATMRILGQMMSMTLVTLVFAILIGQVKIEPSVFQDLMQAISICFFISASLCVPGFIFSLVRGRIHLEAQT